MTAELPLDIVIVDDETSVGTLYEMRFRKVIQDGKIRFHFFESAKSYLDYLIHSKRHPGSEVLLTDINMPGVSGLELLTQMRRKYPAIDVFMMSAYDDEGTIQKSKDLGAKGYFTKPVNYKALQDRIKNEYGVNLL